MRINRRRNDTHGTFRSVNGVGYELGPETMDAVREGRAGFVYKRKCGRVEFSHSNFTLTDKRRKTRLIVPLWRKP